MSRYRLLPIKGQELVPLRHCGDARLVWNLALEQQKYYHTGVGHCLRRISLTGYTIGPTDTQNTLKPQPTQPLI